MKVIVGTTNPTKIAAVRHALAVLFPAPATPLITVEGIKVPSGVRDQPMSDEETLQGARNRAKAALDAGGPDADFGVGVEGGVHQIGEQWFECGWIVAVDRHGNVGIGSSARLELKPVFMDRLLKGEELAGVIDDLTGLTDVRSSAGVMGVLTNGALPRDLCYTHGIYFAFARWVSDKKFWQ